MTDKKPPENATDSAESTENKPVQNQGPSASIILSDNNSAKKSSAPSEKDQSAADKKSSADKQTVVEKKTTIDKVSSENSKTAKPSSSSSSSTKPTKPMPNSSVKSPTKSAAKSSSPVVKQKLSKTAVVALLIALISWAGLGGLFYYQEQQQQISHAKLLDDTEQLTADSQQNIEQKIQQILTEQQNSINEQLTTQKAQLLANSQARISHLEDKVARLSQNEPTDWLLHEAEYLVRIAGRTLWLEHDTAAAINLLQDADNRLSELNNPELLPIRKLIYQDIEQLKLVPNLDVEEVVLSLNAMVNQVDSLVLSLKDQGSDGWKEQELELSDDIADWRENLAKSVDKFLSTFAVRTSHNVENIEPLLTPQRHQNLRENLKLKLQLAQWAAMGEKSDLYTGALKDVQHWLTSYFDMNEAINQSFSKSLMSLESKNIEFDFSGSLTSLKALRDLSREVKGPVFSNDALSDKTLADENEGTL